MTGLAVAPSRHDDLLARRADYPVLARRTYLANHTLGAMHRGTPGRLAEYARLWATDGVLAWEAWQPEMRRVADLVGAVVGAPPGTTVLQQNVADLLGDLVSALDLHGQRNRIVYAGEVEWPGSHYLWQEQRRRGAEVVTPRTSADGVHVDLGPLVDALDSRTALVYASHVLFRTATLVDVAPLVARAHEVGALVVLDAYQSAGAVPLDVTALGVDVCVGGSVKYLCGGPGAGWMYVAPEVSPTLRPASVGWFGHARPFDFEVAPVEYAAGVGRFAGGTPGVPAAYAAAPGYQAVLDVGVGRIRERSLSLTQPLLEAAAERGWRVWSPPEPDQRGGHVAFDPVGDPAGVARVHDALTARGFVLDHRPGVGLRVAPHFYTSAEELAAVVAEVEAVLAGR